MHDLSSFQRDTLFVVAGNGGSSGVDIRQDLEAYYVDPVTGGRLYPCLDELVDAGLVEKGKQDDRTNAYSMTERGRRALDARREWEDELIDV